MDSFDTKSFLQRYGYGKGPNYIEEVRTTEFPQLKGSVYLDHTGATLYSKSQILSYTDSLTKNIYGNPHSHNPSSLLSSDLIESVRQRVVRLFNTSLESYDVIFTSGATGSLKIIADAFHWSTASSFYFLDDNHTSVIGIREIAREHGTHCECITEDYLKEKFKCHTGEHQSSKFTKSMEVDSKGNEVFHNNDKRHCSLFAYPAMSNFCGKKYPLSWVESIHDGTLNEGRASSANYGADQNKNSDNENSDLKPWFVLLDAASYVSSSPLDLSIAQPDFTCVSFYKLFGFPTGIGALLVNKRAKFALNQKKYYGGGTVLATLTPINFHAKKLELSDSFEDGTVNFLNIIALKQGFDALERLCISMDLVSKHTFSLAQYTACHMGWLRYENGQPLCVVYTDTAYESCSSQGPIITFNLLRSDGEFYGYSEVEKLAALKNIHLRTGCFCNTGACQKYLGLSVEDMMKNYEAGHVCGDTMDLIDGRPTGAVRISFGYMSALSDANAFIQFLVECFLLRATSATKLAKSEPFAHCSFPPVLTTEIAEQQFKQLLTIETGTENRSRLECHPSVTLSVTPTFNTGERSKSCNKVENISDPIKKAATLRDNQEANCAQTSPYYDYSPSKNSSVIQLKRLCLYPIKSCGAFEVDEWELGPSGLLYDRSWIIVTDSGVSLTQKREPKLCMIKPRIDLKRNCLVLTFQGYESFDVPLKEETSEREESDTKKTSSETISTKVCPTRVCGDRISCSDCGDAVADWLTDVLQQPCRLLRQINPLERKMKQRNAKDGDDYALSLSNVSQFLLVSYKSVHRLHQEVFQDTDGFVSEEDIASFADQFRANFIIDTKYPFEEDNWDSVKVGNVNFKVTGKSIRCQMICINQVTGARSPYPLRALGKLRGTKMEFGIYLAISGDIKGTVLRVNDVIQPSSVQSGQLQ